ncbi:MAG: anthranilate synthase component I family protein [Flavobacteriales bacterium]
MRITEILTQTISLSDIEKISENYEQVVFLNSNDANSISYLALGSKAEFKPHKNKVFGGLKNFVDQHQDWVFGYLSYDLKNEVEPSLSSFNKDNLNYPEVHFFVPEIIVEITVDFAKIHFTKNEQKDLFVQFLDEKSKKTTKKAAKVNFKQRMSKDNYEQRFEAIKEHIQQGDIYEMNFCHEFYAENVEINPFETYTRLNELTNAPFSTFYKNKEQFILCGSPERYIKKEGDKIITQPIKGTAKRGSTEEEDEKIKLELSQNEKERSENIMIVDLVRNDLSKTAKMASVKVEELCKVYSFDTVHQMISTVTSEIEKTTHPVEVLRTTFPMGSMTGAPKVEAMKIIEDLETTKRGIYSGAIGYFKPNQDFDFNVVIRSLLYNEETNYLSFMVGGAITNKANAEDEYNETLLKAEAMIASVELDV